MANRTVSVKLKMEVGSYTGPAEEAAKKTDDIGKSATRTAAQHKAGMQTIVRGAGVAAIAGAGALTMIVGAAANFEKAMSGVAAVSNTSAAEMTKLRDAALKAGADTSFSASEAAQAEAELAKAGVSTAEILGGALTGSLGLAAAGQIDLADAATISAQAMNIWQLSGDKVTHIADVLAAGANKSAADVSDLGIAMKQGGLVAAQLGIGMEDTVGTLAMFADRALIGSDAGTSLKTMLQRLAAPSKEASQLMKRLGIEAFDASGDFVGMEGFAGILQTRLAGLTQEQRATALSTIFGSDAIRAASILFEQGSAGVKEYTAAVNDEGAAGRMAGEQLNNLSGDLEALRGSIETALIKTGSQGTGALRGLAQGATGAVNAFADLPAGVQATAFGLLAVGTGGTAALAAIGSMLPKVREARESLSEMGRAGDVANRALGKIGKSMAVGAGVAAGLEVLSVAVNKMTDAAVRAAPGVESVTKSLIDFSAVDLGRTLGGAGVDLQNLGDEFRRASGDAVGFGDTAAKVTRLWVPAAHALGDSAGVKQARRDIGDLDTALAGLVTSGHTEQARVAFEQLAFAAGRQGVSISTVESQLPQYRDAVAGVGNAATLAGKETDKTAGATKKLGTAADGTTTSLEEEKSAADQLKDTLDILSGRYISVEEAEIRRRDSLVKLTESVKDNGRHLTQSTEKTRANRQAVIDAVEAANARAQAEVDLGGDVVKSTALWERNIIAVRNAAVAAGLNKAEVDKLITSIARIPPHPKSKVDVDTADAKAKVLDIQRRITQVKGKRVEVRVTDNGTIQKVVRDLQRIGGREVVVEVRTGGGAGHGGTTAHAAGGWLTGGVPGRDSVRLANGDVGMPGEFVVNAASAQANAGLLEAINNGNAARSTGSNWSGYRPTNGPTGPATMRIVIDSAGSRMDDLLVEMLRKAIGDRGGGVEFAMGRRK